MNWFLFIILGAGCGWLSAGPLSGKSDGNVGASMAIGALSAVVIGVLVTFVIAALATLVKLAIVVFGVLIVLALLGAGKSD